MKSNLMNATKMTAAEMQVKISKIQARINTLNYIVNNKHYTKSHRYEAAVEMMQLEDEIIDWKWHLNLQAKREERAAAIAANLAQKSATESVTGYRFGKPEMNWNLSRRHAPVQTEVQKRQKQQQQQMYKGLEWNL